MLLLIVCAGAICLSPTQAVADETPAAEYKPQVVPECKVYKTKAHGEVCGYSTIEEVRALYAADSELADFRMQEPVIALQLKLKTDQVTDLKLATDAATRSGAIWEGRSKALSEQLVALDLKYQKERVKPRWGTWLSWGTAGVLGAAALGFVGHSLLVE